MGPPITPETFRALADAAPILLWASGPDGGCTFFNQAWIDFTGRPLEEQLGDGWLESVHPEDRDRCIADYREALGARRPLTLEYRLRRRDGAHRWMLDTGAPREDGEGAFAGYVGVCIDVTERREAEETTRRSERRFREFVENTGQVWWFISTDYSRVYYVSPSFERVFGRALEEAYKDPWVWAEAVHPEDREAAIARLPRILEGPFVSESRLLWPTGEVRWVRSHTAPIRDERGEVTMIAGITEDVTEHRRAEQALRKSRERLELAVWGGGLRVWEFDLTTGRVAYEDGAADWMGYAPGEIDASAASWMRLMHPEDAAKAIDALREHLAGRSPYYRAEQRIRTKSGERRWILDSARVVERDAEGRALRLVGVQIDITEQRRTEDELRLFRERYLRVLEATRDVFFTLDARGRFVDANPAFERVTGYEVREWLGRGFRGLVRSRNREDAARGLRTLLGGEPIDGAGLCIVSKSGAEVFVDVSATPVVEEGEVVAISCVARDVTERRRAEAALRESERRLRNMAETLPAGAVYVEGVSLFMNRLAEEITGYRREEIPNIDAWFRKLYGARAAEIRRLYEADRRAGFGDKRSVEFTRKDGARRWAEFAAYRSDGGEVWLMTDVTESREAEERLRRTQFAVEHAGVEIYRISQDGIVVDANEQGRRALGYPRDALVGMSIRDIDADYAEEVRGAQWRAMRRDGSVTFRSRTRSRDGRVRPAEITANYYEEDGRGFCLAVVRDITGQLREEEERRRLEARVQHGERLESLGLLAGGVAHDFNNLLGAILGHASLARLDVAEDSPAREALAQVELAARRAAELTNQMLAYAGKGRFRDEPVDVALLVQETTKLLRVSIAPNATLRVEAPHEPIVARGDPTQLRQIVMNLITNAADAIGERPGLIAVKSGARRFSRAELAAAVLEDGLPEGEYAFIEVADTGCGMDAETRERIFDPFFTTKFTGRGLGLAAVLGIVRGHRGAVIVESAPGEGSAFRVLLPRSPREAVVATSEAPRAEEAAQDAAGGALVLVVDDDEAVGSMARRVLERSGFRTLAASGGAEAVEVYRRRAGEIDAVLLDMTMPGMSGREALAHIRRIRPDARVLLSSGFRGDESGGGTGAAEADGFLQKPYAPEELAAKVRAILRRKPG